jgi:hypothetical protein
MKKKNSKAIAISIAATLVTCVLLLVVVFVLRKADDRQVTELGAKIELSNNTLFDNYEALQAFRRETSATSFGPANNFQKALIDQITSKITEAQGLIKSANAIYDEAEKSAKGLWSSRHQSDIQIVLSTVRNNSAIHAQLVANMVTAIALAETAGETYRFSRDIYYEVKEIEDIQNSLYKLDPDKKIPSGLIDRSKKEVPKITSLVKEVRAWAKIAEKRIDERPADTFYDDEQKRHIKGMMAMVVQATDRLDNTMRKVKETISRR